MPEVPEISQVPPGTDARETSKLRAPAPEPGNPTAESSTSAQETRGLTFESKNPATGEVLGSVTATPPERIDEVVAAVGRVQPLWALLRIEDRARYMRRMAQAIIDEFDDLVQAIGREQGRPRAEVATLELLPAIDALIWIADDGAKVLGGRRVGIHRSMSLAKRARVAYEPYGVIAVIGAGSAPFAQPLGQIAGALLAGNGVVFKPAARACLTGERIARVLARADLPEGLVRLVHGDSDVGVALAKAPVVAKVLFTGSPAVGREVARECVSREKEVTVELGGKDAMLVLADCNLARAAEGALWAGLRGRRAGARGDRARVRRARGLRAVSFTAGEPRGDAARSATPSEPGTQVGPLASPRRLEHVRELVDEAVDQGARLHCGGPVSPAGCAGAFYAPAVISGVTQRDAPDARADRRPGAGGDGRRLGRAGDRPGQRERVLPRRVGLEADRYRGLRVARELHAGMVWLNDHLPGPADPARPVGRGRGRWPRPGARRGRACARARRRS